MKLPEIVSRARRDRIHGEIPFKPSQSRTERRARTGRAGGWWQYGWRGGNNLRGGRQTKGFRDRRATADYMECVGDGHQSADAKDALGKSGCVTRVRAHIDDELKEVSEPFIRRRAVSRKLERIAW